MRYGPNQYAIPTSPPRELLAELDAAALALDRLTQRAAELTLDMDEQAGTVRIELAEGDSRERLTPTQLFSLLSRADY
jgi:hypothetical protein